MESTEKGNMNSRSVRGNGKRNSTKQASKKNAKKGSKKKQEAPTRSSKSCVNKLKSNQKGKPDSKRQQRNHANHTLVPDLHKGENVLCFHGPSIYNAKILDERTTLDGTPIYKVHYQGWKKSHDEWVDVCRVLKSTTITTEIQRHIVESVKQSLEANQKTDRNSKRRKRTKPAETQSSQQDDVGVSNIENLQIQISIPDDLKQRLVDDWQQIEQGKLVKLPNDPCVNDILQEFLATESSFPDAVHLFVDGLKNYFEQSISSILLYPSENVQFVKLSSTDDMDACSCYGGIHFLRLFAHTVSTIVVKVKLPVLLSHTDIDEDDMNVIQFLIRDILRFLQRNRDRLLPLRYTD
eukprot:gene7404-9763_t